MFELHETRCACALCCAEKASLVADGGSSLLAVADGTMSDLSAFSFGNRKWGQSATPGTPGGVVTWSFASQNFSGEQVSFSAFFTDPAQRQVIQDAFDAWERVANIDFQFVATDSPNVNIRIGFENIDGRSQTLAQALSLSAGGRMTEAFITFDTAERFVTGTPQPGEISLSAVAIHEIGHAIGLNHSTAPQSIMAAFYSSSVVTLQADDIQGVQFIYGAAGGAAAPTDDFTATAATTGRVTVGGSTTGAIELAGDADWFRVDLVAGATYRIDLQGLPSNAGTLADPLLRLLGPAGTVLATDDDNGTGADSRLTFTATETGGHFIAATGFGSTTGTYRVSVVQTAAAPGGTGGGGTGGGGTGGGGSGGGGTGGAAGDDFAATVATTGRVTVGGQTMGQIETAGDEDWFAVVLETGRRYSIQVEGAGTRAGTLADPLLTLYGPGGQRLVADDDGGIGGNALLTLTVGAGGTYFVGAGGYGSATGTYRVSVTALPAVGTPGSPGTTPAAADDLPASTATPAVIAGNGNRTGTIESRGDTDWVRLDLEAGTRYVIDLEGSPTGAGTLSDPYLRLLSATGQVLAVDDDGGTDLNARIVFTPTATGPVYASAQGFDTATGTWRLTVRGDGPVDDFAATTATTGRIGVGASVTGRVERSSDQDWFAIDLAAGSTYRFDLRGAPSGGGTLTDTFLSLYDSGGRLISSDDDGGTGADSQLNFTAPETGRYFLGAAAWGSLTGTYTLTATRTGGTTGGDDFAGNTGTAGNIAAGQSVTGRVDFNGDTDWFRTTVEAGVTYRIDLRGNATGVGTLRDPFLEIRGADGTILATDDDSGTELEASLTVTAPASGTFFIVARGFGTNTGSYQLSLATVGNSGGGQTGGGQTGSGGIATVPLTPGRPATGSIATAGEIDRFTVQLTAGQRYRIDLEGAATGAGTLGDPVLLLFAPNGEVLGIDDDSGTGFNSRIEFTPTTSGTYVAEARAFGNETGSYRIAVVPVQASQAIQTKEGTAGADALFGGDGVQVLFGLDGNDRLEGGSGDDTLDGGAGDDLAVFSDLSLNYSVSEKNGQVTVEHLGGGSDGRDTLVGVERLQFRNKVLTVASLIGAAGDGDILGTAAADSLIGTSADDRIDGGGGNDTLVGGTGDDLLGGRDGNDLLQGGAGDDRFQGGAGNDTLEGGQGADVVRVSGNRADFQVAVQADGRVLLTDLRAGSPEGADLLDSVELVRFADGLIYTVLPRGFISLFEEELYLRVNPDVAAAVQQGIFPSGISHFERFGFAEGRHAQLTADQAFYLAENPDAASAIAAGQVRNATEHFIFIGAAQGRNPHPLFDADWYLANNPDAAALVAIGQTSAFVHYSQIGWRQGRDPSPWFDVSEYLRINFDVADLGTDPLSHFLDFGMREGRLATPTDNGLWFA